MFHVDGQTLDALAGSRRVRRRELLHFDRCVTCRHAAAGRGISDERITLAVAALRSRPRALVAATVIVTLVGVAAIATPLRGAASGFMAVFEPHRVTAVPLTLDEMRSLSRMPDLSAYALTRELRTSTSGSFTNARAAMSAAGFAVRQPTEVPLGVRAASYTVNSPSVQLLSFANRVPVVRGSLLPPLPSDIAGSKLQIDIGATVVATYVTAASAADAQRVERAMQGLPRPSSSSPMIVHPLGPRSSAHGGRTMFVVTHGAGMPLVVVQMPVPRVVSSGVSVQRLASFMLGSPGISPRVAAAFAALGDLSTTLPIPVPIDRAYTQPVVVDGVQGVGVGDDTGIGAAVIWQKNGMLYGVFATRTARQVLAIANSLR